MRNPKKSISAYRTSSGMQVYGLNPFFVVESGMTIKELAKRYPTASEYISQIYLIIRDYTYCNNRRLAEFIGVSPSAVSQAVSRLKKLEITEQDKYGMITLTSEGSELAEKILKRHYLLEFLMVKELGYPWDLADKEAGNLQDKISEQFLEHLCERLNHPDRCPHGNPFPGNPDSEMILAARRLNEFSSGDRIAVVRITEEGEREPGLLKFCYEHQVMPQCVYTIKEQGGEYIILHRDGGLVVYMPAQYTRLIRVEPAV